MSLNRQAESIPSRIAPVTGLEHNQQIADVLEKSEAGHPVASQREFLLIMMSPAKPGWHHGFHVRPMIGMGVFV